MRLESGTPALIGALVTAAVAPLVINTIPAINGVLSQYLGVGPGMLGAFSSADACGIGGGGLLAVVLMRRVSPRMAVFTGLLLLLVADLLSATFDWSVGTVALRAVGGIGTGLALSTSTYILGIGNSERNYATSMLSLMAASAIMITIIPMLNHWFDWRAMFVSLAMVVLPALLLSRCFPSLYQPEPALPESSLRASRLPVWIGLSAVTLATFGMSSFFTYLGSIGTASGVAPGVVETSLAISGGFAFIGAVLSIVLGKRLSALSPIALIIAVSVVGVVCATSRVPWVYTAGISAFYCAIPLYSTAQFGLLMRHAGSQRFAVSISAATFAGYALGPAVGGLIIEGHGYGLLQGFNITSAIVAGAMLLLYRVLSPPAGSHQPTAITSGQTTDG